MTDLRDLTDDDLLCDLIGGTFTATDAAELARRLAELRAERDEAYEDSRRSLDRLNRLVAAKTGGIDPYTTDDYLAHRLHVESEGRKAAEAERDRLREAMEEIVSTVEQLLW